MIYTTLNKIREHLPCASGWEKLLKTLGKTKSDNEPLSLVEILDSNGFDYALWCLRSLPEHNRKWRLLAIKFAREAPHLMTDERSLQALDVAEAWGNGNATDDDLDAAWAAARDAAGDAARDAARDAAWDAAWAAAWAAQSEIFRNFVSSMEDEK